MNFYWEIIADRLGKEGWSWGYSSQITLSGQTIFTPMRIVTESGSSFMLMKS